VSHGVALAKHIFTFYVLLICYTQVVFINVHVPFVRKHMYPTADNMYLTADNMYPTADNMYPTAFGNKRIVCM